MDPRSCTRCCKRFSNPKAVREHVRVVHDREQGPLRCGLPECTTEADECSYSCRSIPDLVAHQEVKLAELGGKQYGCVNCGPNLCSSLRTITDHCRRTGHTRADIHSPRSDLPIIANPRPVKGILTISRLHFELPSPPELHIALGRPSTDFDCDLVTFSAEEAQHAWPLPTRLSRYSSSMVKKHDLLQLIVTEVNHPPDEVEPMDRMTRRSMARVCPHEGCTQVVKAASANLRGHLEQSHLNLRAFPCPVADCGHSSNRKDHLNSHLIDVHHYDSYGNPPSSSIPSRYTSSASVPAKRPASPSISIADYSSRPRKVLNYCELAIDDDDDDDDGDDDDDEDGGDGNGDGDHDDYDNDADDDYSASDWELSHPE
jgi:hypothetical protein